MILLHLAADHAQELLLQAGKLARDLLEALEGHYTGARLLERFCGALMPPGGDGVEAHDLARQMKAQHLLFTPAVGRKGLEGAGAHDIQRAKRQARRVQAVLALDQALDLHDVVEPREVLAADRRRQAEPAQPAVRAALTQRPQIDAGSRDIRKREILRGHARIISAAARGAR